MTRQSPLFRLTVYCLVALATGCQPQQPFYLFEDGDLSHYKGMATEIEIPDTDVAPLDEVTCSDSPLTIEHDKPIDYWNITLEEAIKITMANSKIIRKLGGSASSLDSLTGFPESTNSVYDPALSETDPRYGVEAALSAFDAQFSTSAFWETTDRPTNVGGAVGPLFIAKQNLQDVGSFQAGLDKFNATGGSSSISTNAIYTNSNGPTRQWPSDWFVDVTAGFRQPLLQGAGVQFNRIAGPGASPGFNNGVVIARLRTDVALTDFEKAVQDLVADVERAYWALYLSYRELDTVVAGKKSSLETWRKIHTLYVEGAPGGSADREAQALAQYLLFKGQVEDQLSRLYQTENQLRYLMGLAVNDGRLCRPADEPTTARVQFEWNESLCEALARNIDLRRQRWRIKERELEMIAAKNYLLPSLDVVGQYSWVGMGHDLWDTQGQPLQDGLYQNAMQSLTAGRSQEWQLGMELSMPLGFRKELSGVRFAQLNLAHSRMLLKEQELEVSQQLAAAYRSVADQNVVMRTFYDRRWAAKREVDAVQAAYETGIETIDVLLGAQRRLADAEIEYYRSLVNYNLSMVDVHLRKGSILEYNGVYLAEGPWPGKAYFDARRRARSRDAAVYLDFGFTRPNVISRGPYAQHGGRPDEMMMDESWDGSTETDGTIDGTPDSGEKIPTPTPAPELKPAPEPKTSSLDTDLRPIWETASAKKLRKPLATATATSSQGWRRTSDRPVNAAPMVGMNQAESTESEAIQPVSYEETATARPSGLRVLPPPNKSKKTNQADSASGGWKSAKP